MNGQSLLVFLVAVAIATGNIYEFSFQENTGISYSIGRLEDGSSYHFTGQNSTAALCRKYFMLVSDTGEIQTKVNIDREEVVLEIDKDTISCQVSYTGNDQLTHEVSVSFHILDVNDFKPYFSGLKESYDIYENVAVGGVLSYLMPVDLDAGENGTVSFSIISGNEGHFFAIPPPNNNNYPDRLLLLNRTLNYETHKMFNLTLFLHDHGNPQLSRLQHIIIYVNDTNDQTPYFSETTVTFNINENHPNDSSHPFGKINATDEDSATHSQIYYSINLATSPDDVTDFVAVNATNGELYLLNQQKIDYERNTGHRFRFNVEARNPSSPAGTLVEITLNILDVNDELPSVTLISPAKIFEGRQYSVLKFYFTDEDVAASDKMFRNASAIIQPPVNFTLIIERVNPLVTLIDINITQPIDREMIPLLTLSITVEDSGTPSLSSTNNFSILVSDINDNAPQFTAKKYVARISDSSKTNKEILNVTAMDPDEGENGTVNYSLGHVYPVIAESWFSVNSNTGTISLVSDPNISAINGSIILTVIATDNGNITLSNTTTVIVTFPTPITFQRLSYQQYTGFDLSSSSTIYMEFKTNEDDALLLYQEVSSSFLSLEMVNKHIQYNTDGTIFQNDVAIKSNVWYSIYINTAEEKKLFVYERDTLNNSQALEILQTSGLHDCSGSVDNNHLPSPLHIGGVENAFSIPNGRLNSFDFIGCIGTVIIGSQQIDTVCPIKTRNVIAGCHYTSCLPTTCNQYSQCIPYTAGNVCQCKSGFQSETCNEEKDYDPVTLLSSSFIQFILDYNFFFSKWKSSNYSSTSQDIRISFIPTTTNMSGVLFYSKTHVSIQRLEYTYQKVLRYTIFTTNYQTKFSFVSEEVQFKAGKRYDITLALNKLNVQASSLSLVEDGAQSRLLQVHFDSTQELSFFAQAPFTLINLGGTDDTAATFTKNHKFSSCLTSFAIDNVAIPIMGLMNSGTANFTIRGSRTGFISECKLCSLPAGVCPANTICSETTGSQFTCINLYTTSTVLSATESSTPATDTVGETTAETLKLHFIIAIAAAGIIIVAIVFVIIVLALRFAYKRGKKEMQRPQLITQITYHSNENCCKHNQDEIKDENDIIVPIKNKKSNNYVQTSLTTRPYSDIDRDSSINSPCSYRKSTSQETGFHTASENPSTRSSPRRATSEKDSEQDSDFTSYETDSEDLTTSGIEDAASPNNMRLVSSGSSMMGVPTSFRMAHPLSPQEKNVLTPVRPNSSMLLSDDETDTEISTATNRMRRYSDNDSITSYNKWYKSSSPSTIVDGQPMVLYNAPPSKKGRHKNKPSNLPYIKHYKSASPQHSPYALSHTHPGPLSSSPLIKSHRHNFEYPAPPIITSAHNPSYYDPIEHTRLPAIAESIPYPYHSSHHLYPHDQLPNPIGPPHMHTEMPYYTGYQGTNLTPGGGVLNGTTYRDLNSFAKVNPITYWEQQQRLRPTVDQDDSLRFLTEPYRKFDDVSTTPSVAESTFIDDKESSIIVPHEIKRPPGVCSIRNDYIMMPRTLAPSHYPDTSQETTENDKVDEVVITHFPSADCTPTLPSLNDNTAATYDDVYPASYNVLEESTPE